MNKFGNESLVLDIRLKIGEIFAPSKRVSTLARMFGLDRAADLSPWLALAPFRLPVAAGQVVFITGPSGAGKSLCLKAIKMTLSDTVGGGGVADLDEGQWDPDPDRALVDQMGDLPLDRILTCLNLAGLSEPRVWLRPMGLLSDGERYRGRLARVVSLGGRCVIADEFCAPLDTLTAMGICERIRKWADRTGTTFILAGSRIELIDELCPDTVVLRYLGGQADIYHPARPG